MHELSVASAVIDTATRHAEGRRVTVIQLDVGTLRQVVPETLAFYFEHVARGTLCEGARLEQQVVPALLRCRGCEHEWELDEVDFRCRACRGGDIEVVAGDELEVVAIDVVEEDACIAYG